MMKNEPKYECPVCKSPKKPRSLKEAAPTNFQCWECWYKGKKAEFIKLDAPSSAALSHG